MNYLIPSLSLTLLVGCGHPTVQRTACLPLRPTAVPEASLRYPEILRSYHLGRYIDPGQSQSIHERHTLYRVESTSRWNLNPTASQHKEVQGEILSRQFSPIQIQTNDLIVAEVHRQRDATERVMWESFQLARTYDQVKKTLTEMSQVASNHLWMRTRLTNTEYRLQQLELKQADPASTPSAPR